MGSPIIGPPFNAQMMPDSLPPEMQESLAVYFNMETMGTAAANQAAAPPSMQTAIPSLTPPLVSTSDYLDAINSVKRELKDLLNYNDQAQSLLNLSRWYDNMNFMNSLAQFKQALMSLGTREANFSNEQKQQLVSYNTGPLAAYNTALTAANTFNQAMRTAQEQYLQGTLTAEAYNIKVSEWNTQAPAVQANLDQAYSAYVTATTNLNALIAINNTAAEQLNNSRKGFGIKDKIAEQPLIPISPAPTPLPVGLPNGPSAPQPPSIPQAYLVPNSYPLLSPVSTQGTGFQGNSSAYVQKYYADIHEQQFAGFLAYTGSLTRQETYRALLLFNLAGKSNINPAYIDRFPKAPSNQSAASPNPVGGVALIASSLGLSANTLSGAISLEPTSTLLADSLKSVPQDVQEQLFENATLALLKGLQRAALFTGAGALGIIGNNLEAVSPSSPATEALIAASSLKTLTALIASGGLEQNMSAAVTDLLKQAGLSPGDIANIVKTLSAGATIGVLLFAVQETARALKLPGLVGQFLAQLQLQGVDIGQLIAQASINDIAQALKNPITVLFLKDFLSKELVKKGFNIPVANLSQPAVTQSLQRQTPTSVSAEDKEIQARPSSLAISEQEIINQTAQNQQMNNALIAAQNLSNTIINRALESQRIQTSAQLRTALESSLKLEKFSDTDALELAQRSADFIRQELSLPGLDMAFNQRSFEQQSLQNKVFLDKDVQKVLRNDYSFETVRDFRDRLSSGLEKNGLSYDRAAELSNTAAAALQAGDLRRIIEGHSIDRQRLEASLNEGLKKQGFTPQNAQFIASNTTNAVLAASYPSQFALRESLTAHLTAQGLPIEQAQILQAAAVTVPLEASPLKTLGNGDLLTQEQLISQLTKEITTRLKLPLGTQEASHIANLTVMTLFGTAPSQERAVVDVKTTINVQEQFKAAFETFTAKVDNNKHEEALIAKFSDQFKETIKGSFDAIDLAQRYANPANSLLLSSAWGLMYSGVSGEPSNFKKSIDIRI